MKYIALFSAALFAANAFAQNITESDTILIVNSPKNITITETQKGLKVTIIGTENDSTFTSSYFEQYPDNSAIKSRQLFSNPFSFHDEDENCFLTSGGLLFGFVTAPGMPGAMDIEPQKSYEISWLNMLAVKFRDKAKRNSLSIGIGIDWRNYRSTKNVRFISSDNNGIDLAPYPDDCRPKYSRLKVFSLGFPIIYKHTFTHGKYGISKFALSAGAILNYNSHASLSSSWLDTQGIEVKETTNHIGHSKFTVDFIGIINLTSNLGIYAKYSPMDVLRDNHGPGFKTFSAGFIFAY